MTLFLSLLFQAIKNASAILRKPRCSQQEILKAANTITNSTRFDNVSFNSIRQKELNSIRRLAHSRVRVLVSVPTLRARAGLLAPTSLVIKVISLGSESASVYLMKC